MVSLARNFGLRIAMLDVINLLNVGIKKKKDSTTFAK